MITATQLVLTNKLGGTSLDREFIDDLSKEYNLDMEYDRDDINNISDVIWYMYEEIIDKFINKYYDELISRGFEIGELRDDMYNRIHINYSVSCIDYENKEIQDLLDEFGI